MFNDRMPSLDAAFRLAWVRHRHELRFRLVVEGFPENAREPFLPLRNPGAVMLPDHLLGIAEEFGHVSNRDARFLQKDTGERVTETMRRGLDNPRPA